jgi:flagellar biosynthetic protein FliP
MKQIALKMFAGLALVLAAVPVAWAQAAAAAPLATPLAGGQTSADIIQLLSLLTVLAVAPGILIMVTSFPRFIIVFSILRAGIGLPTTPANIILISLSLFMTAYIMAPVMDRAWSEGIQPLVENRMTETEAFTRTLEPFRAFMTRNVREKDLDLFVDLARERGQTVVVDEIVDMRVLIPAFMISEIRRAFEIGFLVVLPFLVIDLIVATIVMAMGMMMLPPSVVSLPFKILFFVMIDGWNIIVGSLVRSVL